MISRTVTVNNNYGLHARPATFFIQKANSYKSSIWVDKDELGIEKGMDITLIADGEDEAAALDGLASLIETGFNE